MPEPVALALGVAMGKLLLRWAALNDTADALEDTRAGFNALKALCSPRATDPVSAAITHRLEQRLPAVRDKDRREQMKIAVLNVAAVFNRLTDADIVAAAQHPLGFPGYLAGGTGQTLLANTGGALTPFSKEVMAAGAAVFAELAPRSGRFTAAALIRLLDQVDAVTAGVTGLHEALRAARGELAATIDRVADQVDALHPKVDRMLDLTERAHLDADVVAASRWATDQGVVLGSPLAGWEPDRLGVHSSITVDEETSLTPYISREHDSHLRDLLTELRQRDTCPVVLLVSGTSCTGKTRTLYEAVREVLPDWPLVAPMDDTKLADLLRTGIPDGTVVWLDEIQRHLTKTADGVRAAKAITALTCSDQVGPILFAGTIWPTNLAALVDRPTPAEQAAGASAIPDLLKRGRVVDVPDVFTAGDLERSHQAIDLRLAKAIDTATATSEPDQGRKITQVLAGGTQLVNRLHPPPGNAPLDKFSPAASAVLHAAGDLRRIGMPNPIPRWAIEGAAPGYLEPPTARPAHTWLPDGLDEATRDATTDDQITGNRSLDVHAKGVPALTPPWITGLEGGDTEAYDLHDYLYQDHLNRHRSSPTRPQLWDILTSHHDDLADPVDIARAAQHRGLLSAAINLIRPVADTYTADTDIDEDLFAEQASIEFHVKESLGELLATRGSEADLAELRNRAVDYWPMGRWLDQLLATRGDEAAETELRERERTGDESAQYQLINLLSDRANEAALAEARARNLDLLREQADPRESAQYQFITLITGGGDDAEARARNLDLLREQAYPRDEAAQRELAEFLADRGDKDALAELRDRAANYGYGYRSPNDPYTVRLAELLAARGDEDALAELRAAADSDNPYAKERLAELLAARGDENALAELRARTDAGDRYARSRLGKLLASLGDEAALAELRALAAAASWPWKRELVELLAALGDEVSLAEIWAEDDDRLAKLRARLDDDWPDPKGLAEALAARGDEDALAELRDRAANYGYGSPDDPYTVRLAELLAARGDDAALAELRALVLTGWGGLALLGAYRKRSPARQIFELDCNARPVYTDSP